MKINKFRTLISIGIILFFLYTSFYVQAIKSLEDKEITNLYDDCNVQLEDVLLIITMMSGDKDPEMVINIEHTFNLYGTIEVERADYDEFNQFAYTLSGFMLMYLDTNKDGEINDEESHFIIVMLSPFRENDPPVAAVFRGHLNDINTGTFLNRPNCGLYEVVSFGELVDEEEGGTIPFNSKEL